MNKVGIIAFFTMDVEGDSLSMDDACEASKHEFALWLAQCPNPTVFGMKFTEASFGFEIPPSGVPAGHPDPTFEELESAFVETLRQLNTIIEGTDIRINIPEARTAVTLVGTLTEMFHPDDTGMQYAIFKMARVLCLRNLNHMISRRLKRKEGRAN